MATIRHFHGGLHRAVPATKATSQANLHARLVAAIYAFTNASMWLNLPNPAATLRKVTGLHNLEPKSRYIREDQQTKWYAGVQALKHRVAADLLLCLALTGARRDEMRLLCWSEVDFENGVILFRDTKNGRDHRLPLEEHLRRILENRKVPVDGGERVFPIEEDMVYHHAKKVIQTSGVAFSPRDLRRGFATIGRNCSRMNCWSRRRRIMPRQA